jgi:hypothetical protein
VKSFKGFAHIGTLADNRDHKDAPVGELSALSQTFTRDQTKHTSGANPGFMLRGFSYYVNDVKTQFPDVDALKILGVIDWTYGKARLGTLTSDVLSVKSAWTTDQAATFDLKETGTMVMFDNNKWAPSYLVFAPKDDLVTRWKIWFSEAAFFNQFDEFEFNHVKPLTNLDDFFLDYVNLKPLLATRTLSDSITQVDTLRKSDPETRLRVDPFDWVDPIDRDLRISVDWMSLLWGEAGNNLDSVKESLIKWILANSTHTREEWAVIFPDIFTSTEFIFVPMWDEFAVPERPRESGIYRGAGNMVEAIAKAKVVAKGVKYTPNHITAVANDCPTQFKSVRCVVVGGPENRDQKTQLVNQHPDWLNVPTTHVDFMRMSELTRGAVMLVMEMLQYAEEMTATTAPPTGFNRTVRDGVMYISKTYQKFLYLVVTKASFDELVTE